MPVDETRASTSATCLDSQRLSPSVSHSREPLPPSCGANVLSCLLISLCSQKPQPPTEYLAFPGECVSGHRPPSKLSSTEPKLHFRGVPAPTQTPNPVAEPLLPQDHCPSCPHKHLAALLSVYHVPFLLEFPTGNLCTTPILVKSESIPSTDSYPLAQFRPFLEPGDTLLPKL